MNAVHHAVTVGVELGLDPQLFADPRISVFEFRDDLGLSILETRARLAVRRQSKEKAENEEKRTHHVGVRRSWGETA
ncbi:MAG: hypothetical protein Rubg2KO_17980 [Rubricoccaceae bacterium]